MVFIMRHLGIERTTKVTQPCLGKKRDTSKQLYQEQIKLTAVVFVHHLSHYNCAEENSFLHTFTAQITNDLKISQLWQFTFPATFALEVHFPFIFPFHKSKLRDNKPLQMTKSNQKWWNNIKLLAKNYGIFGIYGLSLAYNYGIPHLK